MAAYRPTADRPTDRPIADRPTDRPTADRQIDRLQTDDRLQKDSLTDRSTDRPIDRPTDRPTDASHIENGLYSYARPQTREPSSQPPFRSDATKPTPHGLRVGAA